MVMALTATVLGRRYGSMTSRSMTTDVSSRPLSRRSGTGLRLLVHDIVKVFQELFAIDAWGATKKVTHESDVDQTLSTEGTQLTHGDGVPRQHEGAAIVQRPA